MIHTRPGHLWRWAAKYFQVSHSENQMRIYCKTCHTETEVINGICVECDSPVTIGIKNQSLNLFKIALAILTSTITLAYYILIIIPQIRRPGDGYSFVIFGHFIILCTLALVNFSVSYFAVRNSHLHGFKKLLAQSILNCVSLYLILGFIYSMLTNLLSRIIEAIA
jgi:hypothetical protein